MKILEYQFVEDFESHTMVYYMEEDGNPNAMRIYGELDNNVVNTTTHTEVVEIIREQAERHLNHCINRPEILHEFRDILNFEIDKLFSTNETYIDMRAKIL